MRPAWDTLHSSDADELDLDLLAAYAEGTLSPSERAECEELMARNPEALHLVAAIWKSHAGNPRSEPLHGLPSGNRSAKRPRTPRGMWLAVAASLLVAITAGLWGVRIGRQAAGLETSLLAMQDRLTDTQIQLVAQHKGRYLALTRSGVRDYWNGTVTPTMLDLPQSRSIGGAVPPEAVAEDRQAQQALKQITQSNRNRGRVLLEQIAIDIAAGRLKQADATLKQVAKLLGETPDVLNARAMRSLAAGKPQAIAQAEQQLRRLVGQHPDFLPGWYNLALLLEQTGRDAESRRAWHEYLKRETRKGFRRVAQLHLSALQPAAMER